MGAPGPDRGKGGKYFLILPEYDGEIPEGYFSLRSLQVTYSGLFFAVSWWMESPTGTAR